MRCRTGRRTSDGANEPPIGPDWAAPVAPTYFNWRKISIYGGSNEIQKQHHRQGDPGALSAMDFDLSEEQALLKQSVDRLMADHYGFEQRKAHGTQRQTGWSRAMWRRYAELGLLGLPFAERRRRRSAAGRSRP